MNNTILASVLYDIVMPSGKVKKSREKFLVYADNFKEAELKVIENLSSYDNLSIVSLKRIAFSEIFKSSNGSNCDAWYKAVVGMITIDEKSSQEKEKNIPMLVEGGSPEEALSNLNKGLANSVIDWRLKSLIDSGIVEVI